MAKLSEAKEEELEIDVNELSEEDLDSDEEDKAPVSSLSYVKDEDFPLFLTVRRLILMIDATLNKPFFERSINNQIIGMSTNSEWHNEIKGIMQINKEYKRDRRKALLEASEMDLESSSSDDDYANVDEDEQEELARATIAKLEQRRQKSKRGIKSSGMSFEIDYDYFERRFFPMVFQKTKLDPLMVWTEISSYIKGSAESYRYVGMYLTKSAYVNLGRKKSLLSKEDKAHLWDIFIEYERWKVRLGAYDFQDVVSYILYQITFYGYSGVPLHFMMIDEVQDLTHATLMLLLQVTEQNLFFSGDTAQTIAKGVGFRFSDLRSLFMSEHVPNKFTLPEIKQLTINFRSHGKILDLANSVISLVECLFPETIDKLAKEKSDTDGPMPTIINSSNKEHLFYILFGSEQQTAEEGQDERKPAIQFGCNQVVIVRNQESKKTIPELLQHALCLTIYEVKGLEFEDVILYNFFSDSYIQEQWRILGQIVPAEDHAERAGPQTFDTMKEEVSKFVLPSRNFDNSKYSLLCTELKQLYVAITRPRQRLIIFDENSDQRFSIEQFWNKLGVIKVVNFFEDKGKISVEGHSDMLSDINGIASGTSTKAWKVQGIKMMKHRFYSQAVKCFNNSGDRHLEERARAYELANEASKLLSEAESSIQQKKVMGTRSNKNDKKQVKEQKIQAKVMFGDAARAFETLGLMKHSAKCYSSSEEYKRAAELFESVNCYAQAAEAYMSCKKWRKAAELFENAGEYNRAIDCYALRKDWDQLLSCISRFSKAMKTEEREALVKKYIPLALEQLMPRVVPVRDEEIIHSKAFDAQIKEDSEEDYSSSEEEPGPIPQYLEEEDATLTGLIVEDAEEEDEYHQMMENSRTSK